MTTIAQFGSSKFIYQKQVVLYNAILKYYSIFFFYK